VIIEDSGCTLQQHCLACSTCYSHLLSLLLFNHLLCVSQKYELQEDESWANHNTNSNIYTDFPKTVTAKLSYASVSRDKDTNLLRQRNVYPTASIFICSHTSHTVSLARTEHISAMKPLRFSRRSLFLRTFVSRLPCRDRPPLEPSSENSPASAPFTIFEDRSFHAFLLTGALSQIIFLAREMISQKMAELGETYFQKQHPTCTRSNFQRRLFYGFGSL